MTPRKPVRLVGLLSPKVEERTNPHSYFYLDVKGKDGQVTSWACEGAAGPGALSRRGFNKTDIKVGDTPHRRRLSRRAAAPRSSTHVA